jgi:hypothetical protein
MRFRSRFLVILITGAVAPVAAAAGPCAGFTDVSTADAAVCSAVEWLKNRSITLGCAATAFCPEDVVVRKHMALFMQRLGGALTPVTLHAEQYLMNVAVPAADAGTIACPTTDYTVGAFARTARFTGQFFGLGGPATLQARFRMSTDAGGSWQYTSSAAQMMGRDAIPAAGILGAAVLAPPITLQPGTTYRFSLGLDGDGSAQFLAGLGCQVEVTIDNANPATSPLDE